MSKHERMRHERLATVQRRRSALLEDKGERSDRELLLSQFDSLERQLRAGGLASADWEDHELHWQAHASNLRTEVVANTALAMLAFEDLAREDPTKFDGDENVTGLLHWWLHEGGREQYLGSIPIAERQRLEQLEAGWKKRRESNGAKE